jgi:hypothetical protein
VKRKLSEKKRKKVKKRKKSEKSEKIDLNFASLCFASKQKLLNRSEAKNFKRKKRKKAKKANKSKKIDLLYINDLPLNSLLNDFLFAVDTTLPELLEFVNVEFHKICTYFRQNKLVLHPGKTQFALFSNSRDARDCNISIFVNNNNHVSHDPSLCIPIERVQNPSNIPAVKFLGLYFDTELTFKHHIKTICTRVSRVLYMLRTCKNFLSEKSLKILLYGPLSPSLW